MADIAILKGRTLTEFRGGVGDDTIYMEDTDGNTYRLYRCRSSTF